MTNKICVGICKLINIQGTEFTNIYCNCNKHLIYEAFYYICENNRIFYKIKIGVPTAPTNQSIIIL